MKHMNDFENFVQIEAICRYLRSFGYKAQANHNNFTVQVQDPKWDTFVIAEITSWDTAREFIKVRAES